MDYVKLGLGNATSIIAAIDVSDWGTQVTFSCLYDFWGTSKPYKLMFQGCTDVRLSMGDYQASEDGTAELIGFSLGEDARREPAVITTDIFEVSVVYDVFHVVK